MKPLISVILPVYNGEKYICKALDSILYQTYQHFELIVIDDSSTDATPLIIKDYQKNNSKIQVIYLKQNKGLTACLNLGIQAAHGQYIARMDADDICLPKRFEKQVRFLENHPDVAALGAAFRLIDASGHKIKDYVFSNNHHILIWNFLFFNPICHPSVMIRMEALRKVGFYDEKLKRAQDYDLWWRISAIGKLSNLKENLLIMRQHDKRVTNQYQSEQNFYVANIGKKHIGSNLNIDAPPDIMKYIREKCYTAETAASAGNIMIDYAVHCAKNAPVHAKFNIVFDAFLKVLKKTWRFYRNPIVWRVWYKLPRLLIVFV